MEAIRINQPSEDDLKSGNIFDLEYDVSEIVDKSTIRFYSANKEIASVTAEGKITIIAEGTVVINVNAKTKEGELIFNAIELNIPASDFLICDVTQDGIINGSDATLALSAYTIINSGKESPLSAIQEKAADVDGDGKITGSDATLILRYYTKISSLVAGEKVPTFEEWFANN